MKKFAIPAAYGDIHTGIVDLLEAARRAAARSVNALMTASYWEIGRRIVEFEQGGKGRAGYGEALIERLADDLTQRFGRGFSQRNLEQMRQFYLGWPIPQTLSAESSSRAIPQTVSGESRDTPTIQTSSGQSPNLPPSPLVSRCPGRPTSNSCP